MTRDDFDRMLDGAGLSSYQDALAPLVLPAITLTPGIIGADAAVLPVGSSRFGGEPDLPPGTPWPVSAGGKTLRFLAQINLADIAGMEAAKDLPPAGLLSFFYYVWDFDLYSDDAPDEDEDEDEEREDLDYTTVLYTADAAATERQASPVPHFPAAAMGFAETMTAPIRSADQFASVADYRAYGDVEAADVAETHQLLGNPGWDFAPQWLKDDTDGGGERDWRVLVRFAEDEKFGWWWGKAGMLYLLIPGARLAQRDFSRVRSLSSEV